MRNKSSEFATDENSLARIAKALAHPARVRILKLLASCGRCITGTLVDDMPLAQATVSQHLRELREAGLIRGEVEGPATCYCLDRQNLQHAAEMLQQLFGCCRGGTDE